MTYSYEAVRVTDLNEVFYAPELVRRNPFLGFAADRPGRQAHHQQGHAELRAQHRRQSDLPEHRHASVRLDRLCRLGRQHQLHQAAARGRHVLPRTRAGPSVGFRAQVEYIRTYGSTTSADFRALFLGGEYSIRGFDIRSIGPRDPLNPSLVLGGNKSLLFNAEYLITIAGPVRLVLFYDTGQVRDTGEQFAMKEDITGQ